MIKRITSWIGTGARAFVALIGVAGISLAVANYTVTQGTGTDFGSRVLSAVHYAQQLLCDMNSPTTNCAAVAPGNTLATTSTAIAVADPNLLAAVNSAIPACTTSPCTTVIGAVVPYQGTSPLAQTNPGWAAITDSANKLLINPCLSEAQTSTAITLATATVKVIAAGVAAKKIYVCQLNLNNNAADSVAIFEATTGTACVTSAIAVVGAGTSTPTAATGYNFGATGGISIGNGANQVLATSVNNNDLCVGQSVATQLSGSITYVTR